MLRRLPLEEAARPGTRLIQIAPQSDMRGQGAHHGSAIVRRAGEIDSFSC